MAMLNNQRVRMETRQTSVLFGGQCDQFTMDLLRRSEILRWHLIMIHFCLIIHPFSASEPSTVSSGSFTTPRRWFWNHPMLWWSWWQSRFRWAKRLWIPRRSAQTPALFIGWDLCQKLLHTEEGTMHRKKVEIIYSWYISFGYALQLYLFPCVSRDFASCRLKFNTYVRKLCIICWRGHTEDLAKHCLRGKVAY